MDPFESLVLAILLAAALIAAGLALLAAVAYAFNWGYSQWRYLRYLKDEPPYDDRP